jgi:hypothetical protein
MSDSHSEFGDSHPGGKIGQMRPKTPILPQFFTSLTLSLLKTRKPPAFFSHIFLNMLIISGELYPRHRHLSQTMG